VGMVWRIVLKSGEVLDYVMDERDLKIPTGIGVFPDKPPRLYTVRDIVWTGWINTDQEEDKTSE
jgi:hypothetical protein